MKVSAVIFCRKDSKRIKGKMYQKFHGKSLIENKLEQLIKSKVDEIIVGSNDEKIGQIANRYDGKNKKKVKFFLRQKKYCIESCAINNAIKNMLSFFKTDLVLWAHLTNPLTTHAHYNQAINFFMKNRKKYDSLFSVTEIIDYFWGTNKKPINHNPQEKFHTILSTGKIKPLYRDNGAIFIRAHKAMLRDGRFWGEKGLMYIMNRNHGWDINKPWDLESCQLKSFLS